MKIKVITSISLLILCSSCRTFTSLCYSEQSTIGVKSNSKDQYFALLSPYFSENQFKKYVSITKQHVRDDTTTLFISFKPSVAGLYQYQFCFKAIVGGDTSRLPIIKHQKGRGLSLIAAKNKIGFNKYSELKGFEIKKKNDQLFYVWHFTHVSIDEKTKLIKTEDIYVDVFNEHEVMRGTGSLGIPEL